MRCSLMTRSEQVPMPEGEQDEGTEEGGHGAAHESASEDAPPQEQPERPEHEGIENPDKNPAKTGDAREPETGPRPHAG